MIGIALSISFFSRLRQEWTGGAFRLAFLCFPVQSILLAGIAAQLCRVDSCRQTIMPFGGIISLSSHGAPTGRNRAQLVVADPAIDHFLFSRRCVEMPSAVG